MLYLKEMVSDYQLFLSEVSQDQADKEMQLKYPDVWDTMKETVWQFVDLLETEEKQ